VLLRPGDPAGAGEFERMNRRMQSGTLPTRTGSARQRERRSPTWLPAALAGLLFLSGFSALVYQILWLRLLSLVFGVTVHAASAVLASFMAGLALGSTVAGRIADRVANPLRWFAAAEAGVALSALATPHLLSASERLYTDLYPALAESPRLITAARFLCSFAVLIIPTMLMGATLPLAVRSSLARFDRLGERVSLLYASNTSGAIAGTLLAGFYMIGEFGISATFRLAAAVNLLVCLIAGGISLVLRRPPLVDAQARSIGPDLEPDAPPVPDPQRVRPLVLAAFAVSGAASLALEIIWFRVLVLFVPATIYAFSTMLATFLTGIAAGSALITPLMRRQRNWLRVLAIVQFATALAILLSLRLLSETYQAGWRTSGTPQASAVAVFPATLLMGIAFPIGVRLYAGAGADASRHVARRIGVLYSVNVCGAILGAIGAAFLLLPALGSRMSLLVVACMYVVTGLLLLAGAPRSRLRLTVGTAVAGVAAFAGAAIDLPDPFDVVQVRRYRGEQRVWREEGVQTTVSVHVDPQGGRVLYLDGLHQANSSAEMTKVHAEIGHLPMALHPDPKDALVVGLGGGVTAGAVSMHHDATVDVVELSQAVARGSDWFREVNHDVLRRPNVRLRIDDGRNFLMLTSKRYDVVTADLIQPIHAGAGNLYSVEYFRLAHAVLKRDGLMLQWIGHRSEAQYKLIMRTFLSVFPHTTLWADGSLMVGAAGPLRIDRAAFERKRRRPETRAALDAAGLGSFEALLGRYTAGPEELRRLVESGPVLSDDRPMIEYHRSIRDDGVPIDLSAVRGDVQRYVVR
jgi:spermidine synthase